MPGDYIVGREEQVYISEQTAFGTLVWPAAGDAIKHLKCSIERKEERTPRRDQRGTRSRGETVVGRRSVTWSLSGLLIPSGALGTPPDAGLIFKHAFGVETVNAGISVVYSLLRDLEATLMGLSIHRFANHMHQAARDCIIQDLTIKASGSGEAEFEASGDAAEEILTGSSTLAVAAILGATSITVATGDGVKYSVDSRIDVGTSPGHQVTAIAADVLTITPGLASNQGIGVVVIPNKPAATTTGSPISGIIGQYQIDAATVKIISASVKLANKLKMRNNEYGSVVATGFASPEPRDVTFEKELYLSKDYLKYYGHARNKVQKDLALTIGSMAGSRAVIDMNKTEFDLPAIDLPEADEATIKIAGTALPTATEDEITLTFN